MQVVIVLIMYLNRLLCVCEDMDRYVHTVHKQAKTGDQNRQGNINKHTRQNAGREDTGTVILITLNYLPNDGVKSEHFQY